MNPVYCGQDFKDLEGYTIIDVSTDCNDENVTITLGKGRELKMLTMENSILDGETMFIH